MDWMHSFLPFTLVDTRTASLKVYFSCLVGLPLEAKETKRGQALGGCDGEGGRIREEQAKKEGSHAVERVGPSSLVAHFRNGCSPKRSVGEWIG